MRVIAWLVIVLSLIGAIVASVTAYVPKLTLPEARLTGLTLNAPAGVKPGTTEPLATPGAALTPELIEALRQSGESRVRVREFRLRNWGESWLFALGCLGMLGGAVFIRRENARQLAVVHADADTGAGPDAVLAQVRRELDALRSELTSLPVGEQREQRILTVVGRMIAQDVPAFIAARPVLVSRLGLGGYAQLMDRFAAGERQLNRAWSAAADGYEAEAVDCLDQAAVLLAEAEQRLAAR